MPAQKLGLQIAPRLLTGLFGVLSCLTLAATPAFSEEPPSGAAGMKVFIDPQSGNILSEPVPGAEPLELTPQELNARSTSDQNLVEVPSPVPGGGVGVNLQGRFQSPLIGTIDANGHAKIQH